MKKKNKCILITFILLILNFININIFAQDNAKITCDELIYNFGSFSEADGPVSHTFTIKNEGKGVLIIHQITASCGCTKPEWTKSPITSNETGEVKVTYDPTDRPGPFYKTISIYSNAENRRFSLGIKGNVTPKPIKPTFIYPYKIGHLKIQDKSIIYSSIYQGEIKGTKISVLNEGKTSLTINFEKVPEYLNITANPEKLSPNETGEISVLMDSHYIKHKGRISTTVPVTIKSIGEKDIITDELFIASNIIDDFSKLSKSQKRNAPIAQLSGTLIDFKKLPEKRGFSFNNKVTKTLEITNVGKSPLEVYSISCDDKRVSCTGIRRTVKPGASAKVKITLQTKKIRTKFESLINIVCNDPHGPVRFVKITANK